MRTPEQRSNQRVKFKLPVEILVEQEGGEKQDISRHVEIIDISEEGMSVITNYALPTSPVAIYINLPPCYSDNPRKAKGISIAANVAWSKPLKKLDKYTYGFAFKTIDDRGKGILQNIVKYELEKVQGKLRPLEQPRLSIQRVPHSCNMYAVDLTVGCENGCKYCHFALIVEDEWKQKHPEYKDLPVGVDMAPLYELTRFPESVVYLSPSSDAFAPKARELTHELLSYLLPKGVLFTISTKALIPDKTIQLLKKYPHMIEGIAVGVTNLDDERNRIIEPGCPSASERLEQIKRLGEIGCSIGARMDPIFPMIDDTDENLQRTIGAIAAAGAVHMSGTFLFTFGKYMKQLKRDPFLKASIEFLTERSYPMGGLAYSAPLEYRLAVYEKMHSICKQHGIKFSTCGCKEVRLKDQGYPLICRNLDYYDSKSNG